MCVRFCGRDRRHAAPPVIDALNVENHFPTRINKQNFLLPLLLDLEQSPREELRVGAAAACNHSINIAAMRLRQRPWTNIQENMFLIIC